MSVRLDTGQGEEKHVRLCVCQEKGSQSNMAAQSVDPAGLSLHVESCPLLM